MEYRQAPEVEAVAKELIEEHHEVLEDRGPIIDYVMMRSTGKAGSRIFKIQKVTGINAFLAAEHKPRKFYTDSQAPERVVVMITAFQWQQMGERQQRGLLDHILSHLRYDYERESWVIEPPEFGEFPQVLERHGFWRPGDDFKRFASTMSEQLSMLPPEELPTREEDQGVLGEGFADELGKQAGDHFGELEEDGTKLSIVANGRKVYETEHGPADAETGELVEEQEPEGARA